MPKPKRVLVTMAAAIKDGFTAKRFQVLPAAEAHKAEAYRTAHAARCNLPETLVSVTVAPYKPRKIKARVPVDRGDPNPALALRYAVWLAERAGIAIPFTPVLDDGPTGYLGRRRGKFCQLEYDWLDIPGETVKRAFYNGTREVQKTEKRIRAVEWGHTEPVYNTRKDGKRGAFLYNAFVTDLRIDIPHWDHITTVTEETLDSPTLVPATERELQAA